MTGLVTTYDGRCVREDSLGHRDRPVSLATPSSRARLTHKTRGGTGVVPPWVTSTSVSRSLVDLAQTGTNLSLVGALVSTLPAARAKALKVGSFVWD